MQRSSSSDDVRATNSVSQPADAARLSDLTSQQWKSGIAAWLGWLFDGLDMHLYTIVAAVFVAELLGPSASRGDVNVTMGWIQASFLVGWAIGGAFFGRIGDRLGRSRALMLTILTYACFTGLSFFATKWWHLLIFRFLAALGIGGEWAVGAALLSETWPSRWRPWLAATLQTGVNCGVLLAMAAIQLLSLFPNYRSRNVFLVGVVPAFIVLWIRRAVPETEQWHAAAATTTPPSVWDLFRGSVRRITVLTILVCSFSLTAHWAFMFWCFKHVGSMPGVAELPNDEKLRVGSNAMVIIMVSAIVGNFLAGWLAKLLRGYRPAIVILCLAYFASMSLTYSSVRTYPEILWWLPAMGASSGVFAIFTMYMPPLFPTLLRTTGAGFCYNIGRLAAAAGTVVFGHMLTDFDVRQALLASGFLFLPAAGFALLLPEPRDETPELEPTD